MKLSTLKNQLVQFFKTNEIGSTELYDALEPFYQMEEGKEKTQIQIIIKLSLAKFIISKKNINKVLRGVMLNRSLVRRDFEKISLFNSKKEGNLSLYKIYLKEQKKQMQNKTLKEIAEILDFRPNHFLRILENQGLDFNLSDTLTKKDLNQMSGLINTRLKKKYNQQKLHFYTVINAKKRTQKQATKDQLKEIDKRIWGQSMSVKFVARGFHM